MITRNDAELGKLPKCNIHFLFFPFLFLSFCVPSERLGNTVWTRYKILAFFSFQPKTVIGKIWTWKTCSTCGALFQKLQKVHLHYISRSRANCLQRKRQFVYACIIPDRNVDFNYVPETNVPEIQIPWNIFPSIIRNSIYTRHSSSAKSEPLHCSTGTNATLL